MSTNVEPNPPSRRTEDFPKTNTMPEGWVMEELMELYNRNGSVYDRGVSVVVEPQNIPVPTTEKVNGKSDPDHNGRAPASAVHPANSENEGLFSRRLDPFPSNTDLTGAYL